MLRSLSILLLLAIVLAGCATPISDDTYELSTVGFASEGTNASFGLDVVGHKEVETDHVGGHYWVGPVDDPTAAFGQRAGDCAHVAGVSTLPGTFQVTCDLAHIGDLTVFGHARVVDGDDTFNYWSEPHTVTVTPEADTFALTLEDLEETATGVSFTLAVAGDLEGTSDHVGGHFWGESTDAPTVAGAAGGCVHVAGVSTVPGSFQVTCDFGADGPTYYRGHLRVTMGDEQWNYWSDEHVFGA